MNQSNRSTPTIEPLLTLTIQTRLVRTVGGTPLGERTVFDIAGGTFEGPGLRGQVLASGGDWLIRTAAGSQLDVRLLLETDDGVTILFRYAGKASQRTGHARIEIAGGFEAPDGLYGWLNQVQAFGLGERAPDGIRYHLFRFS